MVGRRDGPPSASTPSRRAPSARRVDAVLGAPDDGWDGRRSRRGPTGRTARTAATRRARAGTCCCRRCGRVQERVGWISPGALNYVCRRLDGAAGRGLRRRDLLRAVRASSRAPPRVVHVCDDIACTCVGVDDADRRSSRQRSGPRASCPTTARPPGAAARASGCATGRRPRSSVIAGERAARARARADDGRDVLAARWRAPSSPVRHRPHVLPQAGDPALRLLRRVGRVDPTSLDDYRAHGGYAALRARDRARARRA